MAVRFQEHDQFRLKNRLTSLVGDALSAKEIDQLANGDLDVVKTKSRRVKRAVKPLVEDDPLSKGEFEKMVGPSLDLVPVWYLDEARRASRAVCRILTEDREAEGTGVLVSPQLLLTNNHVISGPEVASRYLAQFDYELDADNNERPTTVFTLDPDTFFWTSVATELDFTLVAVGPLKNGPGALPDFGFCPMAPGEGKHAAGDHVTLIQHPDGEYKQIALRDNRVIGRGKQGATLHYASDTLPGSSGSPVFNDQFELVALHHAGGPKNESQLESGKPVQDESNEGIRISRIVKELQDPNTPTPEDARVLLSRIFD